MCREAMQVSGAVGLVSLGSGQDTGEDIVGAGAVCIMAWEKYKIEAHDNWWLNFVRASRLRIEQLRNQYGPSAEITWLVYGPGYNRRQSQEKENIFSVIDSVRSKFGFNLIYFQTADQFFDYLNHGKARARYKLPHLH